MFKDFEIPQKIKEDYKYAIEAARSDTQRYREWITSEIEKVLTLINSYDKICVIGWFGSRLIQSQPSLYTHIMLASGETKDPNTGEEVLIEDDKIEVLTEYVLNLATAMPNEKVGVIPTEANLQEIYKQLEVILTNLQFFELAGTQSTGQNDFDHWLRATMVDNTIGIRGDGYTCHTFEVYKEMFAPFDGFLNQYHRFTSSDLFEASIKLEHLVTSKIGNPHGAALAHKRFVEWNEIKGEEMIKADSVHKHFMNQFLNDNPDLTIEGEHNHLVGIMFSDIESYHRFFWVIPKTEKEKKIFEALSISFGDNANFLQPPRFKGFPTNDSIVKNKPLIKYNGKYYCFSINLTQRNLFSIAESLIESADKIFYEANFLNNTNSNSRDNFTEAKVKSVFEKFLPTVRFYSSLNYNSQATQVNPHELDIIGISEKAIYVIEVKAGQLSEKHRRGDVKGLKQRLTDIITKSAFQCHRASEYIKDNSPAVFTYAANNTRNKLKIVYDAAKPILKISVSYEHLAALSANLNHLIDGGLISPDYKYTWCISLYDLMVFSDLIESENDFIDYLNRRMKLFDRNDVEFYDELDLLEFFLDENLPLPEPVENKMLIIQQNRKDIDEYFNHVSMGTPFGKKPKRKIVAA